MNLVCYDTETTGLDLWGKDRMFSFSACDLEGKAEVYRLGRDEGAEEALRSLFNGDRSLICHNVKFDLKASLKHLQDWDLLDRISFHDTSLQSKILMNNHPNHKLKNLCFELAGFPKDDEEAIWKVMKGRNTMEDFSRVPEDLMDEYQKRDVQRCALLHRFFYPKIERDARLRDIYRSELDLIPTTIRMERRGSMIDFGKAAELIFDLETWTEQARAAIIFEAGKDINPASQDHIRELLFNKLGLPVLKRTAKEGKESTSKDVLLELRDKHRVIDEILKFRSFSRGITTIRSYMDFADEEGAIHPDINTCGAITGRESCSKPNLQNVSKEGVLLNPFPIPARRIFRPRPGMVNFHIDYSGIEMRLLVHYAREPELIEVLNRDGDVHLPGTLAFYGDEYRGADKERKKVLRGAAKNMNFAVCYGAGPKKVAEGLGMGVNKGLKRYSQYKERFPKLVELNGTISSRVRKEGQIKTTFGRPIKLPRNMGYMGVNYLIQGTAAEILKRSQPRIDRYLRKATGDEAGILLPIHDELVIEYPIKMLRDAPEILGNVRDLMIDFSIFSVPLEVDIEISLNSWAEKKPYKLRLAS